jgi:cation transport regulator ChaB
MPYGPSDKLPPSARAYTGKAARAFKHAFNACYEKGHEEARCYKIAHHAAKMAQATRGS